MTRGWFVVALLGLPLAAQVNPHAGYVYPAGGQRGTSVEVRVGGQYLNSAKLAYVSGRGVEAKVIEFVKPPTGKETQNLRDEMQQLSQKRQASFRPATASSPKVVFTEADQKRVDEIRDVLEEVARRPSIPSIAEIVRLQIAIAPDAAVGPRQLRLETAAGLSNPIVFCVGELPEYSRKPTRVGPNYNVVNGATPLIRAVPRDPDPPVGITLPVVVNGQMMPGVSDQYRFSAKKGQDIVIAASARELNPYVSDAVPGWFQAAITLRDAQGKDLASADHFLFHPDPLLHYEIPSDGEYIAEIHDSIYRGREDFIYRMTIGELPVLTSIFPLGAKPGARIQIETRGWNLPASKVTERFSGKSKGVYLVSVQKGGWTSNSLPFALDSLPETIAKTTIGRREKAQKVKLPVIVNGRIAQPGQAAFFRFDGRAGDQIVAEVLARRLGSPLDSSLRLTDAAGKQLAFNDDFKDKGAESITHQADSLISFKLPAKGTYYLQLADTQHNGGPDYGYRLRISQPRPDFELRVAPSSFNIRSGATVSFPVYALRRDGFSGDIALKLIDMPPNFDLSGAVIPSGQDQVRVTLTAPRAAVGLPLSVQLTGQAMIDGHEVTRTAVAAEDMQQAFMYHHLVPMDAWMVRVIGSGGGIPWLIVNKPLTLRPGASTPVEVFVPAWLKDVRLALNEPPEGISIQSQKQERDRVTLVVRVQADKVKPGLRGNLILDAFRDVPANPAAGNRQQRRQPMGTLPAMPFAIVAAARGK